MEKIKLFIGPERSGKTKAVQEYCKDKITTWINVRGHRDINPFLFSELEPNTNLIVFDDVHPYALSWLLQIITHDKITVNRRGHDSVEINRPEIIITCRIKKSNIKTIKCFSNRIEIVDFSKTKFTRELFHANDLRGKYALKLTDSNRKQVSLILDLAIKLRLTQDTNQCPGTIFNRMALRYILLDYTDYLSNIYHDLYNGFSMDYEILAYSNYDGPRTRDHIMHYFKTAIDDAFKQQPNAFLLRLFCALNDLGIIPQLMFSKTNEEYWDEINKKFSKHTKNGISAEFERVLSGIENAKPTETKEVAAIYQINDGTFIHPELLNPKS